MAAPAMSSSVPMRPTGTRCATSSRVVAGLLVHVRSERAGRDAAHHDVVLRQAQRHAAGQVDQAGLARGVGVGLQRVDRDAVDRGDVDHLGGALARSGLQVFVQSLGEEERRLHVQVHHLVPAALGEGLEGLAPGGAGVVHQDVQGGFAACDLRGQRAAAFHGGHVQRQRDAGAQAGELGRRLVAGRGLARGDVDAARPGAGNRRRSCGRCRASRR